jgi:predicted HTH domain antitoxin
LEVNILLNKGTILERELLATVRSGIFRTEDEALAEAIGTFFAVKPYYLVEVAIEMFKDGEVSLSRAAKIAGMNRWRFQDLLAQRGIKIKIEVDEADVRAQSETIRNKYLWS